MENNLFKTLKKHASPERKKKNEYFFKTNEGGYSADDIFIGVRMPDLRGIAKGFRDIEYTTLQKSIASPIHEMRLVSLLILLEKNKRAIKENNAKERKTILKCYLDNLEFVNNWDLVDVSAHYILGQAIIDGLKKESILDRFVMSKIIWERRVAIVSTWIMIRAGKIDTTLRLAEKLLNDQQDLIHKAVGWMLRESWKKKPAVVEAFLKQHYNQIPRTTLRYAIERMDETKRKKFLNMKKK